MIRNRTSKVLSVRMRGLPEIEQYAKSVYTVTRQLSAMSKAGGVPELRNDGGKAAKKFAQSQRDQLRNQSLVAHKTNKVLTKLATNRIPKTTRAQPLQSIKNKLGGIFDSFKSIMRKSKLGGTVFAIGAVTFGISLTALRGLQVIGGIAITVLRTVARQASSFFMRGVNTASMAQMDFISQVNTMATLQGKSYEVAAAETKRNNEMFSKVASKLPGNMATYTQIYQNGLDEQMAIFGTVEGVLEDVQSRGANSFTALLGKAASEAGMPAEMVIRDLAQLRNQSSIQGIGIVRTDIRMMQAFEKNRERSLGELIDIIGADASSFKGGQFRGGDKRLMNLYATLVELQNPDKDIAQSRTLMAIIGRLGSQIGDTTVGLKGFARVLGDSETIVDKATYVLKEFSDAIIKLATVFVGSALDPLEALGKGLNELRYRAVVFNRRFNTFLDDLIEAGDWAAADGNLNVTVIANRAGEFVAKGVNMLADAVTEIFDALGKTERGWSDPTTVLGTFAQAFYKDLDVQAITNAGNGIVGVIRRMSELILASGRWFWARMRAAWREQTRVDKDIAYPWRAGGSKAGAVGYAPVSDDLYNYHDGTKPHSDISLGSLASLEMPNGHDRDIYRTLGHIRRMRPVTGLRTLTPLGATQVASSFSANIGAESGVAMQQSGLFEGLSELPDQFQRQTKVLRENNQRMYRDVRTLQGSVTQLAMKPEQAEAGLSVFSMGDLPPVGNRSMIQGQKLIIMYGKYMESRGHYIWQHPAFGAPMTPRYSSSYHSVGINRAVDGVPAAPPNARGSEQLPLIRDSIKWFKATGQMPVEFIHGSYDWAESGGMGLLDTPANPTVGGIHGGSRSHLHVAMYKGNLSPLRSALAQSNRAQTSTRPDYTVHVREWTGEELCAEFEVEVDRRLEKQAMITMS